MIRLGQQLLVLARADSWTRPQDSFVRTDLCEWGRISGSEWIASARAHNVEIELSAPEDPVWIDADPLLLEDLLGNLIDNALRYGVDARHIRLRLAVNPPSLVVEDDGRGIDPDDSERVFEAFYSSTKLSRVGSGLGLAIVRTYERTHGARGGLASRER